MARIWHILTVAAVVASLLSGLLAAVSLVFAAFRITTGQIVSAGLAEYLLSFVFLAAGIGLLFGAWRAIRLSREPPLWRTGFIVSALLGGVGFVIIGASGLVWPDILGHS